MKKNKNKTFEEQLFNAMTSSGLLFPLSDDQVSDFEQVFGKTTVKLPEDLSDPESILIIPENRFKEPLIKMAAFSKDGKSGRRKKN